VVRAQTYGNILLEMKGLLSLCRAKGYGNCNRLGQHYLDASGTPTTIDLHSLIAAQGPLRLQYQYWVRDNAQKLLTQLASTPAGSSASLPFDTAGTTTNWAGYTVTDKADWYYALHGSSIRMRGDLWIGPAVANSDRPIQLRYRAFMFDVYDFGGDFFGQFSYLHDLGWAAEFLVTVQSPVEVTTATLANFNPATLTLRY
jgi:hypothetical protein